MGRIRESNQSKFDFFGLNERYFFMLDLPMI